MLKKSCILLAADGAQTAYIRPKIPDFQNRFCSEWYTREFYCQSAIFDFQSDFGDIIKNTWTSEIRLHTCFWLQCLSG